MRAAALLAVVGLAWTRPSLSIAHQGHLDDAAWPVCSSRSLDDRCEWVTADHQLARGTCRQIGGELVCVRNRPLQPVLAVEKSGPIMSRWCSLLTESMPSIIGSAFIVLILLMVRAFRRKTG